jgi:sugar lactone lactonase YvrE
VLGVLYVAEVASATGDEYALILARYGKIHTIAGRGTIDSNGGNDWLEAYEGGPARDAELSEAHNAQADVFGNVYIVDKDSHAVRKVTTNGTIHRMAGTNVAGDGADDPQPGAECALTIPNGLHVHPDGTCFIFDTGNRKIRRLDPDGTISTVFTDPALSFVGRGLWANADGSVIYYANGTEVREWTASDGIRVLADSFSGGLGNLTVDPQGRVVVTDRTAHSVYRVETDGTKTRIAGNGLATGGGDGQPALETALEEVRGVAFVPSGGFFACTHRGSDVWFIDTNGIAHLFINGVRNSDPFSGEGTVASSAGIKLSEARAINLTPAGDLIITQSDESTIPLPEQFYVGGARTVRGYREDQFHGRRIAYARNELRIGRTPREGFYGFADAGYVLQQTTASNGTPGQSGTGLLGYGFGVRSASPLGRIDLSFAVSGPISLESTKVHVFLEQNF